MSGHVKDKQQQLPIQDTFVPSGATGLLGGKALDCGPILWLATQQGFSQVYVSHTPKIEKVTFVSFGWDINSSVPGDLDSAFSQADQ